MAVQGFGLFIRLLREGHEPSSMGFHGSAGDVTRWQTRYNLARKFRGLNVEEVSEKTLQGYNAFFQVFLTHSTLELYLPLVGLNDESIEHALIPLDSESVVREFFRRDRSGKLFEFLHQRLKHKNKIKLAACRDGHCMNVFYISSSIRHIFAHGHLSANANRTKPDQIAKACKPISDFLLDFMECDFTCRVREFYRQSRETSSDAS